MTIWNTISASYSAVGTRRRDADDCEGNSTLTGYRKSREETILAAACMCGLGEIRIAHPPNTFALTPASLIALEAIARNKQLLAGRGLDWGSGTGCLAIAAARVSTVGQVIGLEIAEANVAAARRNAISNGVADRTTFLLADSYSPIASGDRSLLGAFAGQTDFILANPPASDGDDGFGWRRRVLSGAREFLRPEGRVFLNVSSQYGPRRLEALCEETPGFAYGGVLASTDWVAFDLGRADLLDCLRQYAFEETRGGLAYAVKPAGERKDATLDARDALARFDRTGESPLMKWQTHLFEMKPNVPAATKTRLGQKN